MQEKMTIYTDGGSRGNPGPSAAAFILLGMNKKIVEGRGLFLGNTTNNVAEYTGLVKALSAAQNTGTSRIEVFSDSELMVRQINGEYKVKSPNLKEIYAQCMDLLVGFTNWQISHIPRNMNKQADALANRAMDLKKDVQLPSQDNLGKVKKIRLGILLSGGGRTMVNIQKEIDSGNLNAKIAIVISSRSTAKGIERAREMGLEPVIIRKKDYKDIEQFSRQIEKNLKKAKVDLVIQAGWLCLWKIPKQCNNRVMNIHPALLPSFGGQGMWGHHVHEAVLKAGCKVSGCTVHFCTDEYDKGQIIVQRCCEVKDSDDTDSLAARVFEQECIAYPEAIRLFCKNRISQKK